MEQNWIKIDEETTVSENQITHTIYVADRTVIENMRQASLAAQRWHINKAYNRGFGFGVVVGMTVVGLILGAGLLLR